MVYVGGIKKARYADGSNQRNKNRGMEREREKDNRPWRHDATHYPFSRNGNEREREGSRRPVHEVPRLVFVWGVFKLLDFSKLEV